MSATTTTPTPVKFDKSSVGSVHWTALIIYLSVYWIGLFCVTIIGWALYQAKPKKNQKRGKKNNKQNNQQQEQLQKEKEQDKPPIISDNNSSPINYKKYFTLWRDKWRILLSAFLHILIQALNFCVMVEFISLSLSETYYFNPNRISNGDITEICIVSFIAFIAYRFGSAILIWKLSHSVRKSTFQIIDITILYQLLKGYKRKTRNNPGRIVQYINYLNAMFQSGAQATVQLVFIMKTRIIGDSKVSTYPFIIVIFITLLLNIYVVTAAIYEKDQLLTSESYRKKKTFRQVFTHASFRLIDVALRFVLLAMLWLTIGFGGCCIVVGIEFVIIGWFAYYTQQHYRLQEMVAVLLHIEHFKQVKSNKYADEEDKLRPMTPATIRAKNQLEIKLNIDPAEIEKKEAERKRDMIRECQCFKWRILTNIIYMVIVTVFAETQTCVICPDYEDRSDLIVGNISGTILTIFCWTASVVLYPVSYWSLKNSSRWNKNLSNSAMNDDNVFTYLERKDLESAKEILEFGKKVDKNEYISWANQRDWSTDNNPNLLLKFLYQQKIKISDIINMEQGGLNILHQIAKNPELENASTTIKFLVDYLGIDIHSTTSKTGNIALHIACSHCNKSAMISLLNEGNGSDDLFIKNNLNQTALHSLMIGYNKKYNKNQIEMTQLLFDKYNADQIILEVDEQGKSPLHIACINKLCPKDIIKLLLVNGAYSYQADKDDYFPKDYIDKWDNKRKDIHLILKWLKEGIKGNDTNINTTNTNNNQLNPPITNKKYLELTDVDSSNQPLDKSEEEEMRRIYGDDSDDTDDDDDDNDNDNADNKEEELQPNKYQLTQDKSDDIVTPMDIGPVTDFKQVNNDNDDNKKNADDAIQKDK